MTPSRSVVAGADKRRAAPGPGPFCHEAVSLEPASAYEAVTRQMVVGLEEDLREIKARLNGLLFMVAGSVLLEVVTRVMGDG